MDSIGVVVHEGVRRDAILFSAGVNAQHGLRRTNTDKRHVIRKLLQDPEWFQWSDREIGRCCGVDNKTVARYRAELSAEIPPMRTRMVTRQGTTYSMEISNRKPTLPANAPHFLRDWIDLGEIGIKDALRLNNALSDAPPAVVEVVALRKVTDPHSISTIVRMYRNGTGPDSTFEEVRSSGMIQPGDEAEAVPITAGQHALGKRWPGISCTANWRLKRGSQTSGRASVSAKPSTIPSSSILPSPTVRPGSLFLAYRPHCVTWRPNWLPRRRCLWSSPTRCSPTG
jgi:hypothetical protein